MVLGGVLDRDAVVTAGAAVAEARRRVAAGQFGLAVACLGYADARREQERVQERAAGRAKTGPDPGRDLRPSDLHFRRWSWQTRSSRRSATRRAQRSATAPSS